MKENKMEKVVIVDALRTAMGKSKNGCFRNIRAEKLSAELMKAMVNKYPAIAGDQIDDIIWGCVQQTLEQGYNIARNAQLLVSEIDRKVPAQTINRLCGSSMTALHSAAMAIMSGQGDTYLIGGVEHMGHVPMTHGIDYNPELTKSLAQGSGAMGLTAELLAQMHGIDRKQQDEFALRSHQRAAKATKEGRFKDEIVAIEGHNSNGALSLIEEDEVFRADANLESLSSLRPVFMPKGGSVTAGNASALSDGASCMLVMSEKKAKDLGFKIMAYVKSMGVSGCEPSIMGRGPVPATHNALKRADLKINDLELIELNEAFAAQSLPVLKELELLGRHDDLVNVNGGAIALGHPLGCSGARISTTLLHEMQKRDVKYGLATMCIGFGQGVATIFERA